MAILVPRRVDRADPALPVQRPAILHPLQTDPRYANDNVAAQFVGSARWSLTKNDILLARRVWDWTRMFNYREKIRVINSRALP
jgi:hypothetical protein